MNSFFTIFSLIGVLFCVWSNEIDIACLWLGFAIIFQLFAIYDKLDKIKKEDSKKTLL